MAAVKSASLLRLLPNILRKVALIPPPFLTDPLDGRLDIDCCVFVNAADVLLLLLYDPEPFKARFSSKCCGLKSCNAGPVPLAGHVSVFPREVGDVWYVCPPRSNREPGSSGILCGIGIGLEISILPRRMAAVVSAAQGRDEAIEACDLWFDECMTNSVGSTACDRWAAERKSKGGRVQECMTI